MDVDDLDPTYVRVFVRAPIFDLIFNGLTPRTLIRLALTCHAVYLAVANFKSRAYNVNNHFCRYFSDPISFRSLQAKTNSLVSGSNALQFLDRTFYSEADLDLYTHPGHTSEVAAYIVEVEGYEYAPRDTQEQDWKVAIGHDWDGTQPRLVVGNNHTYPLEGISGVWSFEKTSHKKERLKIQIIEASSCPVETILGFHSTVVMNFVSADAAYALYPLATFEERSCLAMPPARHASPAVNKYVKRGWRFYFMPTFDHISNPSKPPFVLDETRWVGDKYTWVLPLDQTGIKERPPLNPASAPLKVDPSLFNGWKLREAKLVYINGYECFSHPLQTTVFRYNYLIPDEELWYKIRAWVHQQGKYSHVHLSKDDWVWFDADLAGIMNPSRK